MPSRYAFSEHAGARCNLIKQRRPLTASKVQSVCGCVCVCMYISIYIFFLALALD